MNQIRPWLYIGKYRETRDYRLLTAHGITAMLLLAELVEHPGITSLYLAVEDGEPLPHEMLTKGVDFVKAQKAAGQTILVACGAGISRSASFAAAALKEMKTSACAMPSTPSNKPTPIPCPTSISGNPFAIIMLKQFLGQR